MPSTRRSALARLAALLALALAPSLALGQRAIDSIEVLPGAIEFGDVRPGEVVTRTITLVNAAHKQFRVQRVRSTCECTVARLSERVIPARGRVELTAEFDAGEILGLREQSLALVFDGQISPVRIPIRAHVNHGVRFESADRGDGAREITLTSVDGTPFTVVAVNGLEPLAAGGATGSATTHTLIEPELGTLTDTFDRYTVIETDHHAAPIIALPRPGAEPERRAWTPRRGLYILGWLEAGSTRELAAVLAGVPGDTYGALEGFRVSATQSSAGLLGSRPGGLGLEIRLFYEVAPRASGLAHAAIEVTSKGHTEVIDVFARVRSPRSAAAGQ